MKQLLACIVFATFFFSAMPAHAMTFISVESETTLTDSVFRSIACISVNDDANCYTDVNSLQVQATDGSIDIGLNNYIFYE